jgi:hypothetical protein
MKQITGFWKQTSKAGKSYYSSPKLTEEMIEVIKGAKPGDKFLIYPVDKEGNDKRPDIHLTLAEDNGN